MTSLIGKLTNRAPRNPAGTAAATGGAAPPVTRNDATSQMRRYGEVSTLFSIVEKIYGAVGQVDWRLYRKRTDRRRVIATGEEEQRTEVIQHAALDLMHQPNPFMTGPDLFEHGQQYLDLTGEAPIVVVRSELGGLPMELWPVRPDRIEPVPGKEQFLLGYLYKAPDGQMIPLELSEVIHIKYPNPLDPYRGLGPVQAAMVDLDSARFAAEWNRNFFYNSAEPGGHLETEHNLDDQEFRDLQKRWREQHQGVWNAHRVAVLEGGVTWKERMYKPRDMQFAELRGVSRDVLREAFGLHPHILGITENVNKANAYAGEAHFARWVVTHRVRRWKRALNFRLLPMFPLSGDGVLFDHDRIVPEDREADDRERDSKATAALRLVRAGYDPDDVAEALGLPKMAFIGSQQPEPDGAPGGDGDVEPA